MTNRHDWRHRLALKDAYCCPEERCGPIRPGSRNLIVR
jgi:hypothetical protein